MIDKPFDIGQRVRVTAEHCRNTGMYYGPEAPTSIGPHARGYVRGYTLLHTIVLAHVEWDDGEYMNINAANLEKCR